MIQYLTKKKKKIVKEHPDNLIEFSRRIEQLEESHEEYLLRRIYPAIKALHASGHKINLPRILNRETFKGCSDNVIREIEKAVVEFNNSLNQFI